MKSKLIGLVGAIWLLHGAVYAQNVLVNPGGGSYATLGDAFYAIAIGTHSGNVTVQIVGNTTESGSCALFQLAPTTTVTITPVGHRTISGSVSGAPLMDLNGVDNLTLNGLNDGNNSLTISNTAVSSTTNTSTLMIRNDAKNITVRNCVLLGASQVAGGVIGATVFIGNTMFSSSATGNDNLIFENNELGAADNATPPFKAVQCNGFAGTLFPFQERIRFTGNKIHDFFSAANTSNGMLVQVNRSEWLISDNHFYMTIPRAFTTPGGTAMHYIMQLSASGTGTALIENNTIGYATAAKTGRYEINSPGMGGRFYGIDIQGAGATVRGNIITNLSLIGASSGSGNTNPFSLIKALDGVRVSRNTIGSTTDPESIIYETSSTSSSWIYGIYVQANAGNMRIDSNMIAGIKANGTTTGSIILTGAFVASAGEDTIYMRHNTVGEAAAPLANTATGTFSRIIGLHSQRSHCFVANNKVRHLYLDAASSGTTTGNPITGIEVGQASGTVQNCVMNILNNRIHDLQVNNATSSGYVKGIDFLGPATGNHRISANFIYGLRMPNTNSTTATVLAIHCNHAMSGTLPKGTTVIDNNMVALGSDLTSNAVRIWALFETTSGNFVHYYHNSIFIGGSVNTGSSIMTAGIRSYNTDRTFLNNIIQVQRTNTGGTGKHYAMTLGGTGAGVNPPGLNSNRNILRANLANGVVCLYGSVECTSLASWQTASGQDAGSLSSDPLFAAPSAAVPDLHLSAGQTSPAQGLGVFVTGITTDFDGDLRSLTAPDAGADEKITVLPVVWGEIRARRMDTYNLIEWTTLTELDVAGYNILRSVNGTDFVKVGWIPSLAPQGTASLPTHYAFRDENAPAHVTLYYRIQQVDLTGASTYSRTVSLSPNKAELFRWNIIGNPVRQQLQIQCTAAQPAEVWVRIADMQGRLIRQQKLQVPAGNATHAIPLLSLRPGSYTVQMQIPGWGISQTKIFIVEQ